MNIAIVGGGTESETLLDIMEKHPFQDLDPKVVALADERDDAPCMSRASKSGLFVTNDYNDFFDRQDIDLIIEMTGNEEVFYDILSKKKNTVRVFNRHTAQLLCEVSRISEIQDIMKQELDKARTMYRVAINELIQEDVMVISPSYIIMDVNETSLKNLGLTREEVIGRHCYEISHHQKSPCGGKHHPCPLVETLNTQRPSQVTHVHLDKNNNELFFSISCYPIFENDKIVSAMEISRDITKDINLQKVIIQQEKLASIGRLAAGVAHEINNPMTTILTTIMLIQEDLNPEDPNYQELQGTVDQVLRCRKIVTSLLDFARQSKPVRQKSNINDIVLESITLTRKLSAFRDVTMEQNLSKRLLSANVDKDQIQQAVVNLALNAIEATDPGGRIILSTRLAPKHEMMEIAVSDTGHGIPKEDLDKIFEPFFTTKETGTGLGLAITHGFIQQHGGTIDVKSEVGRGTTFTIRLPTGKRNKDVG